MFSMSAAIVRDLKKNAWKSDIIKNQNFVFRKLILMQ